MAFVLPSALVRAVCQCVFHSINKKKRGGLRTAMTSNRLSDSPVITPRDSGKYCGKWGGMVLQAALTREPLEWGDGVIICHM